MQTNINGIYIPNAGMTTLNVHSNTIGYLGLLVIAVAAAATIWNFIRKHLRRGQLLHNWTSITNTKRSYQEDNDIDRTNATTPTQSPTLMINQNQTSQLVSIPVSPKTGGGGASQDPTLTQETSSMTSICDALAQLRGLCHAAKK